mmetsp:Transcript_24069/g.37107  ORF Transcript_24069/g.37107 Transcript_24069/m.37107 type:complete len:441 (+) Transcript_24069:140-1462(+)
MPPSKAALRAATAMQEARDKEIAKRTGQTKEKRKNLEEHGGSYTRKKVQQIFAKSNLIDTNIEIRDQFPSFEWREMVKGKVLGRGGFCTVTEVKSFNLMKEGGAEEGPPPSVATGKEASSKRKPITDEAKHYMAKTKDKREFISDHCIRDTGETRYACKKLSDDILNDPHRFIQGMMDMGVETYFLSVVSHPNIIKIRGVATCDPYNMSYFILLDRLYEIMDKKKREWAKLHKKYTGLFKNKEKEKALLIERLKAAFDLSAAIDHLHKHNILYRDLKPENVGFDIRGDVKLFDFGLAREVDPRDVDKDGTYKLSANTGSLRYMAPEVALGQPYNFSVDVYSFSILLWELMSLETPFQGFNVRLQNEQVIKGGTRPKTNKDWPTSVRNLMQRGWSEDIVRRPSMEAATKILKDLLVNLREGNEAGLEHMQRRSTYVFRENK